MKTISIQLGKGLSTTINEADFEIIRPHSWCLSGKPRRYYAVAKIDGETVQMHRLIMSPPDGMQVDHINRDKLDNRRENLRICSNAENSRNKSKCLAQKSSRFKGVMRLKRELARPWTAQITMGGKLYRLGFFETEVEAAAAYNLAARDLHSEFAVLNPVSDDLGSDSIPCAWENEGPGEPEDIRELLGEIFQP